MGKRIRSRVLAGVAVLALSATIPLGSSAPAQAHDCGGGRSRTLSSAAVSADLTFYPLCSDGKSHWHGVVRDIKCDAKAAGASIVANEIIGAGWQWDHGYEAPNGCGTSATFSGSDTYVGSRWHIHLSIGACNFWTCSDGADAYLNYND